MSLRWNVNRIVMLAIFVASSAVAPVAADIVDYNAAGDLAANFNLNDAGAGNRYSEAAAGGIGGSRAVDSAGAVDAVHTTALYNQNSYSFDDAGDTVTVSQFVYRKNDAGFPFEFSFQQLGLLQTAGGRLGVDSGTDSYVSLRVLSDTIVNTGVYLQAEVRGSGDASRTQQDITGEDANLVAGHWYRFWATFENVSATQVRITGALEDWGTDASGLQSTVLDLPSSNPLGLVDLSGLAGSTVLGDAQTWAGWRGFDEGGAELFDNFSVVPEPGTVVMALFGTVLGLRRRAVR